MLKYALLSMSLLLSPVVVAEEAAKAEEAAAKAEQAAEQATDAAAKDGAVEQAEAKPAEGEQAQEAAKESDAEQAEAKPTEGEQAQEAAKEGDAEQAEAKPADEQAKEGDAEQAEMTPEQKMQMLKHTTPMPILMAVVAEGTEALQLTEAQVTSFKQYREENGEKAEAAVKAIMQAEADVQAAALAGEPAEKVEALLAAVQQQRAELSAMRLACRDKVQAELTVEQWEKLVEMYKAKMG